MDPATVLALTQAILQVIDSSFVKEVGSFGSFKSQVEKLKNTMSSVNAVLVDAEKQERLLMVPRSNAECDWLEKLRDAVYQADDLFDKIVYFTRRRMLMSGNKLRKEVCLFFSASNQLIFAFMTSREVKKIRERLNDISKDHNDFCSKQQQVGGGGRIVAKRREDDSHCFVYVEDVIGRHVDKKEVLDMLLDSSVQEKVHFVTIVGIGGLGKTTLAQLIYNDEMIVREFPLRMWVYVSDEFDMKKILHKILELAANQNRETQDLQRLVRKKIKGRKYLLVLDDVWEEDRHEWLKLRNLLIGGKEGSRVVVTSRYRTVATIVGGPTYELKGLSPEDSWRLFEKMAFRNEEERTDVELIQIGKQIVEKSANVPLAIRVVGSLLYGETKNTWLSFKNRDLMNMKKDDKDGILPMLKLSYHHLTLPLKSCFSYCALFPKKYRIEKEMLIGLWMAHGILQPSQGQSDKDAAEEYFEILLQRCFFQDAEIDDYGEIVACEVHDLMHDVAQDVVGGDTLVVDSLSQLKDKARHLSFSKMEVGSISSSSSEMEKVRTFYKLVGAYTETEFTEIRELLTKARYMRVLCLSRTNIRRIPSTIDKLVHLRYLDLSYNNSLEFLPATLCKLLNLQTLILKQCCNLIELPRDLSKLIHLRCLDIDSCEKLTYMPLGMSKLTCLENLPQFIATYSQIGETDRGKLDDLEALTNLGGSLKISVRGFSTYEVADGAKYIRSMINLRDVDIEISCHDDTLLLEALQPNCNLRSFHLSGYKGATFPTWDSLQDLGTSLPKLVRFSLYYCDRLQHLPLLSRIRHLRTLELSKLDNLEYMENSNVACSIWDASPSFFPFLEKLRLEDLPKLKEWQKCGYQQKLLLTPVVYSFPSLLNLNIEKCPYMTSIPLISNVESLVFSLDKSASSSSFLSSCCLTRPNELTIILCNNESLETLSIVEELFRSHLSCSLRSLHIKEWSYLKSLCGGGLEHLTALQTLELLELDQLEELEDVKHSHMPWKFLTNLCHLELLYLPKLVNFPQGIQYLTALQSIRIEACDSFELTSVCLSCFTSVKYLYIYACDGLKTLPSALFELPCLIQLEIMNCEHLEDEYFKRTKTGWTSWSPKPDKWTTERTVNHLLRSPPVQQVLPPNWRKSEIEPEPEPEHDKQTEIDLPYSQSWDSLSAVGEIEEVEPFAIR